MISTVDVETSFKKDENGKINPLPFNPENILVSVVISWSQY